MAQVKDGNCNANDYSISLLSTCTEEIKTFVMESKLENCVIKTFGGRGRSAKNKDQGEQLSQQKFASHSSEPQKSEIKCYDFIVFTVNFRL